MKKLLLISLLVLLTIGVWGQSPMTLGQPSAIAKEMLIERSVPIVVDGVRLTYFLYSTRNTVDISRMWDTQHTAEQEAKAAIAGEELITILLTWIAALGYTIDDVEIYENNTDLSPSVISAMQTYKAINSTTIYSTFVYINIATNINMVTGEPTAFMTIVFKVSQ